MWRWNLERKLCASALFILLLIELYHFTGFANSFVSHLVDGEDETIKIPISQAMSGEVRLRQDDPRVMKYALDTGILLPPSNLPYNLSYPNEDYGGAWKLEAAMFVIREVLRELNMTDGDRFFVECGGLDGETLSNTLYLERKLGWKGLLVEGNPLTFEVLKSKNRKAWLAKTCLSIHPYPHRARFPGWAYSYETTALSPTIPRPRDVDVQCLPLFTLLSAINVKTVDYFSLDVDGNEFQILKTIPFDNVFIKTLTVEHSQDKDAILEFMKSKGYIDIAAITKRKYISLAKPISKFHMESWDTDFVFVHKKIMNANINVFEK